MSRPGTYHQDYIARIRYSNNLPPPPNPPKLLNIPGTGLGGSQYLSAAFASKLAREQPLNIEADGELGMPIDLVGLPGVFYGDESAITAPEVAPAPHPHDRLLLRPLNQLGKPASMVQGVSFLRRTEYISSDVGRSRVDSTPRTISQPSKKRKASGPERDDDPIRMLRGIYKGFDTAYPQDAHTGPDSEGQLRGDTVTAEDQAAWDRPRHPTNPDLKAIDTYPILPDLEADPGYWVFKFATNPVAPSDTYDRRLDYAILHPKEPFPGAQEQHRAQVEAFAAEHITEKPAQPMWNFHLYLPDQVSGIETAFEPGDNDDDRDESSIYPHENPETGRRYVRFEPQRIYETFSANDYSEGQWDNTVAVALHDAGAKGSKRSLQTAAYYYPIQHRSGIRSKRGKNIQSGLNSAGARDDEDGEDGERKRPWDYLGVRVRELDEGEVERRRDHQRNLEGDETLGDV